VKLTSPGRSGRLLQRLVVTGIVLSLLAVSGCVLKKKAKPTEEDIADDAADTTVADAPDTSSHSAIPCPIPHTVDGRFTGWPSQSACAEWNVAPLKGVYGDLYLHYDGSKLHLLNDWHLRTTTIPVDWYNLFEIVTGNGSQQWQIRVYADSRIEVLLNGDTYKLFADGGYGFGRSPTHNQPHTMFELSLAGVAPGEIQVSEQDPGPGKWETPEKALKKEPTSFSGVLQQGGGITEASAGDEPIITSIVPLTAAPGVKVAINGTNLGPEEGQIRFAGAMVTVTDWDDDLVHVLVPEQSGTGLVGARRTDGIDSNELPFEIACVQDCSGKECGAGSCGGSCGVCNGNKVCGATGKCACAPACTLGTAAQKECGGDGCGGMCGMCVGGKVCIAASCVPKPPACKPQCDGKTCGLDGCGGQCGTCKSDQYCNGGNCLCLPLCIGKQCGGDGCGGTCGTCASNQTCDKGACKCEPDCGTKKCGKDGCGGTCGTCPAKQACSGFQCCAPQCAGKQCGFDGCAGWCGTCLSGEYCLAGKCTCQPKCNAKVCGADGCGGVCGSCGKGTCQADGSCLCVVNCKDKGCGNDSCGGSCGTCDSGETCSNGNCTSN
jgi:hypothetical protein